MNTIKPIETVYNGYRFRSRLEARWAVFFDAARIKYQYEPEGFDLGDCEWYLPDFYLPEFDIFVEIKPFDRSVVKHVGDGNIWEEKCSKFRSVTNHAILLCYGDPAESHWNYFFGFDEKEDSWGEFDEVAFFVSDGNSNIYLLICEYGLARYIHVYGGGEDSLPYGNKNVITVKEYFYKNPESLLLWLLDEYCAYHPNSIDSLQIARTKARQARFEHGEHGAVSCALNTSRCFAEQSS